MDGLLVVDKPAGPTSHDVVVRIRKTLDERRVGHTGTLDPAASGLLPLTIGRATRLSRFLSGADKGYEATIRLGIETDSYDSAGTPAAAPYTGALPGVEAITAALSEFCGTFLQQPPLFSAKKVGGRRSHRLARQLSRRSHSGAPVPIVAPAPTAVSVRRLEIVAVDGDLVSVRVECSAGFYVRSLAHDLGVRLGTGAHLATLRRTKFGDLTPRDAVDLASVDGRYEAAATAMVPLEQMLPSVERLALTERGVHRAAHGNDVGPADLLTGLLPRPDDAGDRVPGARSWYRLLSPSGDLVAVAERTSGGFLHPSIVLV